MLEFQNVTVRLIKNDRCIVNDFNFSLADGEKAALIGEEGNGKSTLLKLAFDTSLAENYAELSGRIIKKGRLGYLPQTLPVSCCEMTAAEYFGAPEWCPELTALGLSREFLRSQQRVGTLSGGEKVKLQLAKLLASRPDALLLDEPTNDLDLETLAWMEEFLSRTPLAVLYVSHDETLLERTANTVIHLEQLAGKTKCRVTVARTGYREYVSSRAAAFGKQTHVAKKQREDYEKQLRRWREIYEQVDAKQRSVSRSDPAGGRLLKKKMAAVQSQKRRFERESDEFIELPQQEDAIITRFDAAITLPRGKTVLELYLPELCAGGALLAREIRLTALGGERIGITGCNGAGKSTLLRAAFAQLEPRSDITAFYMPQNYAEKLDFRLTPVEYLVARYARDEVTLARTCLGCMRFTRQEMSSPIGELSGGQQAKLLLLEAVLRKANVLVLDEPTRNFSPLSGPVVRRSLRDFGGTIISVSHDRKYLSETCTHVLELTPDGLTAL